MFRLVIGCNDHCARNFIIDKFNEKVYSIDDHCLDLDFEDIFNIKMKKDIKLKCKEYMIKYKDELLKILVPFGTFVLSIIIIILLLMILIKKDKTFYDKWFD